jgi:hypothetical protein
MATGASAARLYHRTTVRRTLGQNRLTWIVGCGGCFWDEDRARGVTEHVLRDAAHEKTTQPGPAMRAHNNEIAVALAGDSRDFSRGISRCEDIFDRDIGRSRRNVSVKVFLEPLLVRLRFELSRRFSIGNVLGTERLDDMENEDGSVVLSSQIDGDSERFLRGIRKIRRMKNQARLEHGCP